MVVKTGNLLITSGHVSDIKGKLGQDVSVEKGREAARECAVKILNSVWNFHGTINGLRVLKLLGCVNSTLSSSVTSISLSTACSDLLHENLRQKMAMDTTPGAPLALPKSDQLRGRGRGDFRNPLVGLVSGPYLGRYQGCQALTSLKVRETAGSVGGHGLRAWTH